MGHPSELHQLLFNLPKQRSVNPDTLAELTAAPPHLPQHRPQLLGGSQASHWSQPESPCHRPAWACAFQMGQPPSTLKQGQLPLRMELLRTGVGTEGKLMEATDMRELVRNGT